MDTLENNWFVCPHCGAELAADAVFCRECGASDDSGWDTELDDASMAEDGGDFDYQEFTDRQFQSVRFRHPIHWVAWALLALAILYFVVVLYSA